MTEIAHVDTPDLAYARNWERWELAQDLLGRSEDMRKKGERYLPRFPAEKDEDYAERVKTSFCHGLYRSAVERSADAPFVDPVTVANEDALPPRIRDYIGDIDGRKTSLTQFARCAFRDAASYGVTHILAGHDARSDGDRDKRPVLRHIPALSLIAAEQDEFGEIVEVRYRGMRKRGPRDGEKPNRWDQSEDRTVTLLERVDGVVQRSLYVIEENASNSSLADLEPVEGPEPLRTERNEPLRQIPLVSVYFDYRGFMEAWPPFYSVAELDLEHYQIRSDYRQALHYGLVPMIVVSGNKAQGSTPKGQAAEGRQKVTLSRTRMLNIPADAKAYYLEQGGTSMEAGRKALEDIRNEATSHGAQSQQRAGVRTATEVFLDDNVSTGRGSSWARAMEKGLGIAIDLMVGWTREDAGEPAQVRIADSGPMTPQQEGRARLAMEAGKGRYLQKKTVIQVLKECGVADEDLDVDAEVAATDAEGLPDPDAIDLSGFEDADQPAAQPAQLQTTEN